VRGKGPKPIIYLMTTQSSVPRVGEMLIHDKISTLSRRRPRKTRLWVWETTLVNTTQTQTQAQAKQQMSTRRFRMLVKTLCFFSGVWGMRSYLLKNPETETETKAAAAEQQVTKNKATKM